MAIDNIQTFNQHLDFWYHEMGVNVIPVDSKTKRPLITWKEWQSNSLPEALFEKWKNEKLFNSGCAIITGKIWRGHYKNNYLVCIDIDNKLGIEEILSYFPQSKTLEGLGQKTIVEQHEDDLERAHIYFITEIPIIKINTINLISKYSNNSPKIEVKSDEQTIVICSSSIHKNGKQYKIIGTKEPTILNEEQSKALENTLNNTVINYEKKYSYLSINKAANEFNPNTLSEELRNLIKTLTIDELPVQNYKIQEGNRHITLLSFANSMLHYHFNNEEFNKDDYKGLQDFFYKVNDILCTPSPLPKEEIKTIWNDAKDFVTRNKKDDKDLSAKDNNNTQKQSSDIEQKTEEILRNYSFITLEETKEIYYYKDGVYIPGGDIIIEKEAEKLFGYSLKNKDLVEIKGHITRRTFHKRTELDADVDIINLKNGLYSISENILIEHSPSFLSVNQKPIAYDPKAKSKLFGKFLSQVLYPSEIRTAVEAMAYTFYRDTPFEHLFILFGEGRNGKSVFTGLLTALHGKENVSNVSLLSITSNNFALADLESKDVNIDTELSNVGAKDTSNLKKLTGGNKQPIRIERKFQHARDTSIHAKLFFNTNLITVSADQTDAYFRREILISFPNRFEGKHDDPYIQKKLEQEISGIFNTLMISLRTVLKNNMIYFNKKTIEDKRLKHEISANPVKSFVDEIIDEASTYDESITKDELYEYYLMFCNNNSIPKKSKEMFGKELKKIGYKDGRESKGERRTLWQGIKIKDEYIKALVLKQQHQTTLSI